MNGKYNQPTAHMLQPVKGWDSMAHLDFVAPIASTVEGALPGTVMHLNSFGTLEPGLTAQGMGMYLFYKQDDEDVQPYPLTEDGTQMTAVGMQSFGGYNSEVYLRTWDSTDPYNTNGHASNVGAYNFNASGAATTAKVKASQAAHTTYPAICGMELSSTEYAAVTGAGTSIQYDVNDTLTSPLPVATVTASNPGTSAQQLAGGFLKKGACYVDPICGIVSKKPVINEHGYKQICFWSTWLPAAAKFKSLPTESGTYKNLSVDTLGELCWTSDPTLWDMFVVKNDGTKKTAAVSQVAVATTATKSTTFTFDRTSAGYNTSDLVFTLVETNPAGSTEATTTYAVGASSAVNNAKLSWTCTDAASTLTIDVSATTATARTAFTVNATIEGRTTAIYNWTV